MPPKHQHSKQRTKTLQHLRGKFLTNKTGDSQHYSMCMVLNSHQHMPQKKIQQEDQKIQAILHDAYTPSGQQTFGIKPTHMCNISTSNA